MVITYYTFGQGCGEPIECATNFCNDCGAPIAPYKQVCDACRERRYEESEYRKAQKRKQKRPAGAGAAPASIDDVVRAADAAGLSYGKYMQLVAAGKAPEAVPATAPEGKTPAPEHSERKKRAYVAPARRAELVRAVLAGEISLKEAAYAAGVDYHTVWKWVAAARKEGESDGRHKNDPL